MSRKEGAMHRVLSSLLVVFGVFAGATAFAQSIPDLHIRAVTEYVGIQQPEAFVEIRNYGALDYRLYVETRYELPNPYYPYYPTNASFPITNCPLCTESDCGVTVGTEEQPYQCKTAYDREMT